MTHAKATRVPICEVGVECTNFAEALVPGFDGPLLRYLPCCPGCADLYDEDGYWAGMPESERFPFVFPPEWQAIDNVLVGHPDRDVGRGGIFGPAGAQEVDRLDETFARPSGPQFTPIPIETHDPFALPVATDAGGKKP